MADEAPALKSELERETSETLGFRNGSTITVFPCTSRAIRGTRNDLVIVDEVAHMLSTEGNPLDLEVLRAVRPSLAMSNGRLIVLSSPHAPSGALYDLHKQHFGVEDSDVLVWVAPSFVMNRDLDEEALNRMKRNDPEAWRSEVLGEFRAGVSNCFTPEVIEAAVAKSVYECAPEPGVHYVGFVDASSGSDRGDSFTIGIARAVGDVSRSVCLRRWVPPFKPSHTVAEASTVFRSYGVRTVVGDKYAPNFLGELFQSNGIRYTYSERNRSEIYLEALPRFNSGKVVILDNAELIRELRALERHASAGGRDRVDHPRGRHDDLANACCGALLEAQQRKVFTGIARARWTGGSGRLLAPSGERGGMIWKNGAPWSGICPPDRDPKGRPLNKPAIYQEGRLVGYVE